MGRVQEVAAHSAACNEYHGRQSKHNTTSRSLNHTLSRIFLHSWCLNAELFALHYVENNWSLDCVNEYTMTALEKKKNGDNYW